MSRQKDARDCVNLAYKYSSLRGAVRDRYPDLLNDSVLMILDVKIAALNAAFDARVKEIADEGDGS